MADSCCARASLNLDPHKGNAGYRRVLWAVLAINLVMFLIEIGAGLAAGSASLQADALDFLGDTANYAIRPVRGGNALRYRASAALAKGATMGVFGLWVWEPCCGTPFHGTLPSAFTMGTVGFCSIACKRCVVRIALCLSWPVTRTCAPHGYAHATTCLVTSPCCLLHLVYLARGRGGPISSLQRSWPCLALQGAATVISRQSLAELRPGAAVPAE
jgi:hypothetical protein